MLRVQYPAPKLRLTPKNNLTKRVKLFHFNEKFPDSLGGGIGPTAPFIKWSRLEQQKKRLLVVFLTIAFFRKIFRKKTNGYEFVYKL